MAACHQLSNGSAASNRKPGRRPCTGRSRGCGLCWRRPHFGSRSRRCGARRAETDRRESHRAGVRRTISKRQKAFDMSSRLEFVVDHAKPHAKVSVILLDWSVRESFHSLDYLNRQTVDREQYELIWIEFYDRKPKALLEAIHSAQGKGRTLVDKFIVMNSPGDFIFHKH